MPQLPSLPRNKNIVEPDPVKRPPEPRWSKVSRWSVIVVAAMIIFGTAVAAFQGALGPSILWALGLTTIGIFIGLLFALPRVGSSSVGTTVNPPAGTPTPPPPPPAAAGAANQTPPPPPPPAGASAMAGREMTGKELRSTDSLLEIADWLTKIIVGLGLVNLKDVPDRLSELATAISASLWKTTYYPQVVARLAVDETTGKPLLNYLPPPRDVVVPTPTDAAGILTADLALKLQDHYHHSFALAMAIFFPVAGLLLGYLTTRMFIQTALIRGDRDAYGVATQHDAINTEKEYRENRKSVADLAAGLTLPAVGEKPAQWIADQLRERNSRYQHVSISDYQARVLQKNLITQEMFVIALREDVPKDWLAEQSGDGYLHVLATSALSNPATDDVDRLVKRGAEVSQKHTKYRVAEAFQRLAEVKLITKDNRAAVEALLNGYKVGADQSLIARIDAALQAIAQAMA